MRCLRSDALCDVGVALRQQDPKRALEIVEWALLQTYCPLWSRSFLRAIEDSLLDHGIPEDHAFRMAKTVQTGLLSIIHAPTPKQGVGALGPRQMTLRDLVQRAHDNAVRHGFWERERQFGTLIALVHSELSEALEAYRSGGGWENKDAIAEELADVVIRVADICGWCGLDLQAAVEAKMRANEARPYMHGGKRY